MQVVERGAVYVAGGGQFTEMSGLDSLGLTAVLDLDREHWGEANGRVPRDWEIARGHGLRFVHLPLHPDVPPSLAELEAAVAILTDAWTRPVLVHVDRGVERVAAVVAAYRIAHHGWSVDRALGEPSAAGLRAADRAAWRQRLIEFAAARRARDPLDPTAPTPTPSDDRRAIAVAAAPSASPPTSTSAR